MSINDEKPIRGVLSSHLETVAKRFGLNSLYASPEDYHVLFLATAYEDDLRLELMFPVRFRLSNEPPDIMEPPAHIRLNR